jgi:hypothetical protein
MRNVAVCLVAVWFAATSAAIAQRIEQTTAVYPDTEYVSGKAGFDRKIKGQLVIDENTIVFNGADGNVIFAIPMETVISASSEVETDPGSFGRKFALGVFASKREEFLTVRAHTPAGAEAVVFKGKKKTTPGMVAKINFHQTDRASDDQK